MQRINIFFIGLLALLFATAFSAQAAYVLQPAANQIPEELLVLDHQRCMNGCVPGFGDKTCKPLCDCTVVEFRKKMDYDTYIVMSAQLAQNNVSAEMRALLDGIAKMCAAEIERLGIEVGEGSELPEPSRP